MSSKLSRIWMTALSLATLKSRVPRGGRLNYLPGVGGLAPDSAARLLVTALPLDQNRIHVHIRHTLALSLMLYRGSQSGSQGTICIVRALWDLPTSAIPSD